MTEATDKQLEGKRFVVSPESMEMMKKMRRTFSSLKPNYPFLSGLGFFGSRTKGVERKDSDVDVVIFYNSIRITEPFVGTRLEFGNIREELERAIGMHIDNRDGLRQDLSLERTQRDIDFFIEAAAPLIDKEVDDDALINAVGIPPTQNLCTRFYLVVGEEVYGNRRFIFEKLKEMPNGEKYFQIFMRYFRWMERPSVPFKRIMPMYDRYPETLEEAEGYFLTGSQRELQPLTPKAKLA